MKKFPSPYHRRIVSSKLRLLPFLLSAILLILLTTVRATAAPIAPAYPTDFSRIDVTEIPTTIVTSHANAGAGTLRQALLSALPGDTITFDSGVFPPSSPMTITLLEALPGITQGDLTIDASNAGVVLDGYYVASGDGFHITSDGNVVKGLQIIRFPDDGVEITGGAKNNIIGGDWMVGSAPHGEGNVITLNGNDGVDINGSGTMSNTISGNLIGLDLDGTRDIRVQAMTISPNYANDQTLFIGTKFDGVWKTTDGGSSWVEVNSALTILDVHSLAISPNYMADTTLFAGTADGGIFKTTNGGDSWIRVDGGVISSDVGALAISPDYTNDGHIFAVGAGEGVFASIDWGDTWIIRSNGLTYTWLNDIAISPDYASDQTLFVVEYHGIYASENQGQTWTVASEITGTGALAFSPDYANDQTLFAGGGQLFKSTDEGSSWGPVGGDPGWADIRTLAISPDYKTDRTLFAGDLWGGGVFRSRDGGENWSAVLPGRYNQALSLSPAYAQDVTVFVGRNTAGGIWKSVNGGDEWTEVTGQLMEHGNHMHGVHVWGGAKGNTIGGSNPGERNVISHNDRKGVTIHDTGTTNNIVTGNYIGTDVSGTTALGNGWQGVVLWGAAQENVIGGTTDGERNVISGNGERGVHIESSGTMSNTVIGNYIGTDVSGMTALGNRVRGVEIGDGAKYNRVGGATSAERNVISGNENHGVQIQGSGTTNNTVVGNYVGTDVSGMTALGNAWSGVNLWAGAQYNQVGGTTAEERNTISGNGWAGVLIAASDTMSNTIVGNYIGTDATGLAALGNLRGGVVCWDEAQRNTIKHNVISSNDYYGVYLSSCDRHTIAGNYIGTDIDGTVALGNDGSGVFFCCGAQLNAIGDGNAIVNNNGNGIEIEGSTTLYNAITQNSIHNNVLKGIENWDGGNTELSPPVLTDVTPNTVSGTAPPDAIVEIFSDDEDEGRVYEGSITADTHGDFTFTKVAAGFRGPCITATATDTNGNTSEFSAPVCFTPTFTPTPTPTPTHTPTPTVTSTPTRTPTITPIPTSTSTSTPTPSPPDQYESDNTCQEANPILTNGVSQFHTFHAPEDIDWLRFDAIAGETYLIYTPNIGPNADMVLRLYDECGAPPSVDDDNALGRGVSLLWLAPATGRYYLQLSNHDPNTYGDDAWYKVGVLHDTDPPSPPRRPRAEGSDGCIALSWERSPEQDTDGYVVYFGSNPGVYSGVEEVPGPDTTFAEICELTNGQQYYLAVAAYDWSGHRGEKSREVSAIPRPHADHTQPTVEILGPTTESTWTTTAGTLALWGNVADAGGNLAFVRVDNQRNGDQLFDYRPYGDVADFHVSGLELDLGLNTILIRGYDSAGNIGTATLQVERQASTVGAALIIAGRKGPNETLRDNIYFATHQAYDTFLAAGLDDTHIYYLAPEWEHDRVDGLSTSSQVQQAITQWAVEQVERGAPLWVYLMDHGLEDQFCLDGCFGDGLLRADALKGWLDTFQNATGSEVVVVIEACHSGSFIADPASISRWQGGPSRVVITSTSPDRDAYPDPVGGAVFSDSFFTSLRGGATLWQAVQVAIGNVQANGYPQTPWYDGDGDGVPNQAGDEEPLAGRKLLPPSLGPAPEVLGADVSPTVQGRATLSALVGWGDRPGQVYAVIYPPGYEPPASPDGATMPEDNAVRAQLLDPDGDGIYTTTYDGFLANGAYRIVLYARDADGRLSPPVVRFVGGPHLYLPMITH